MNQQWMKVSGRNLATEIALTLTHYLKTQFLVILIVTIITWIILSILGVQYSLLLAFITGSLSIVPFAGMITAALITGIVAIFDDIRFLNNIHPVFEGLIILIIYIILNQIIDFFIAPYLLGKISKIHPLLVLLFVIIGTWIFGIVGTILTVPLLLVIRTIFNHYSEK
jgi:predicted PurR-regulated permease PerM